MTRNQIPDAVKKLLGTLVRDTTGQEIAEAAAVLPLMFMVLLGIFWFGQAFSIYGTITRAAQEGARAGAAPYCSTCSTGGPRPSQIAVSAVQAAMQIDKLDPTQARYPALQPVFNSCITSVSGPAPCDATASTNICVQNPVQLTSTAAPLGGAGVCGISVSFQYPYQFWLPFTSLNKQQIWLSASARVTMETR